VREWLEPKECYLSSRLLGGGAAGVRRDEVLPPMGILRGGIPAPVLTSPLHHQRNTFHLFLVIYFTYKGNVINSIHWQSAARESDHFSLMLRYLIFKFTRDTLRLTNFEIRRGSCTPVEYDKHLAIPSCFNILIWTMNFCGWRYKFCKTIKQRVIPSWVAGIRDLALR
jgi:hypothetical protein